MSLTNPNTPVSQQDLQDFYHKLLPYMGNSFAMIANKFSKGDLYSTDEKMIGQWIDGKPLYQRVLTNKSLTNLRVWTDLDSSVSYESLVKCCIYNSDVTNANYNNFDTSIRMSIGNHVLRYYAESSLSVNILLNYTKTTDTAISIGSDTDYSTDEKIVGTWIDGSPIYQKVVTGLNASIDSSNWNTLCTISDLNLLIGGYALYNNVGTGKLNVVYFKELEPSGDVIKAQLNTSRTVHIAVLQYTKTT